MNEDNPLFDFALGLQTEKSELETVTSEIKDPLHKTWLEASEAVDTISLECRDEKAAKAFRHRLYRWRDKNRHLCTEAMLTTALSVEGKYIICRPVLTTGKWEKGLPFPEK